MRVVTFDDAASFLSATTDFRGRHPTLTSIIGSVATSVTEGRSYSREYWYVVEENEQVVGCAMRTVPWPLAVSPMPTAAAHALAAVIEAADPDLPGITGPREVAEAIAEAIGRPGHIDMTEFVRVLHQYRPPAAVDGRAREALPSDLELLVGWHVQFAADVGLPLRDNENLAEQFAALIRERRVQLWDVAGRAVAMGGHASLVPTPAGIVARIGPIYTPQPLRGRGYGTAITAALVEHLQSRSDLIMLFTDSANPTSNGIYERIGFDYEGEIVEFALSPAAHDASLSVD
jgi:predicted GNAT family acetyltransferase